MVSRLGMGRKKIEIKRIEKEDARQVCFSKRKAGLIKKAQELSILTGSETAVIVFSQVGKPFSFGYPSVDAVVDRFLAHTFDATNNRVAALPDPLLASTLASLSCQYDELLGQIAKEKKLRAQLEQQSKNGERVWWEDNVEDIPLNRLESYGNALEELRKKVAKRADELLLHERIEGGGGSSRGGSMVGVDGLLGAGEWKKHGLDLMVLDNI